MLRVESSAVGIDLFAWEEVDDSEAVESFAKFRHQNFDTLIRSDFDFEEQGVAHQGRFG
jgi:hypothetical protein